MAPRRMRRPPTPFGIWIAFAAASIALVLISGPTVLLDFIRGGHDAKDVGEAIITGGEAESKKLPLDPAQAAIWFTRSMRR